MQVTEKVTKKVAGQVTRQRILLVEDADFFGNIIEKKLKRRGDTDVVWAKTLQEARDALAEQDDFSLALLDLNLPDASGTEVVEYVAVQEKIPSIVFSASYEREIRDEIVRLGVIDYIIKESPASLEYLFQTVSRVMGNRSRMVLIADDSGAARSRLKTTLEQFQLNVIAVRDGVEALNVFRSRDDISLVITDYVMPNMDGLELTKALMREVNERKVAIIGLSASADSETHIKFLKAGASDFLDKPFEREELFCRVSQNLNALDYVDALFAYANNDELTGLNNRRAFFENGESKVNQAMRSEENCAVMVIGIDSFKAINDSYGHEAGDGVLRGIAERLEGRTRKSDLLARFGGKEFCKLLINPDPAFLPEIASQHLRVVAEQAYDEDDASIAATISIGIAYGAGVGLQQLIDEADQHLTEAKAAGGNRAIICPVMEEDLALEVNGPEELMKYYG